MIAMQAACPAVSQAGLFDWLFHRNRTTAMYCAAPCPTACAPACPTVVQSPCSPCAVATSYAPPVQSPCSSCGAATTAYSPVVAQPTVAYAPAYQTVQAQVPVTYYRPTTTALSPVVGAPAVAGCTAVEVQTQRRASWWNPLGLFAARRPAISPYPINVQYQTTVAYPGTTVLPGPAATVTAPSYAAPAYAAPSYTAPATPGCSSCGSSTSPAFPSVPSVPVNPGTSLGAPPAATYPAPAESPGGGTTVPADQAPSLNAPASGSYQGSSYRPAPAQPITPPDALAPSGLSSNATNASKPATDPPSSGNGRDLQLIPYPGESDPARSSAPPLLNGRGKTASLRSEEPWSYSLIAWPERTETHKVELGAAAPAIAAGPRHVAPPLTPLDDSGWRPARSR